MIILLFFLIHWYASLFTQSFFYHRYAAHRHFTMTRTWEKIFFVLSFITMGSSYISPGAYSIMHRLHHEHTDRENDPHSPEIYHGFFYLMLSTRNNYFNIYNGSSIVSEKYKANLLSWKSFERIAHNWITRIIWIFVYLLVYITYASSAWEFLLLPFTIIMGTLQGAVVNWWAHRFGYVNYNTGDFSKNILPLDLFFWGEAYHNNHHQHPGRANNAHKWYEFDALYCILLFFNFFHIIRLKKTSLTP